MGEDSTDRKQNLNPATRATQPDEMTQTDLKFARLNARVRVLRADLQAHAEARRALSEKVEALIAGAEAQRLNQRDLEQQILGHNSRLQETASLIAEILNSRIWRTLVKLSRIALRLGVQRRRLDVTAAGEFQGSNVPATSSELTALRVSHQDIATASGQFATDRITDGALTSRGASEPDHQAATTEQWKRAIRLAAKRLPTTGAAPPIISIITPTFNTKTHWLAEAALSVFQQNFANWEWCIVDDASIDTKFHDLFSELEVIPRVKVCRMTQHGGISSALNQGLRMSAGRFVCFLDHDDLLEPDGLDLCSKVLLGPFDAVYSDEDKISDTGVRHTPLRKPDWSPEFFRGVMYLGHLLCVRRDLAIKIGGFDSQYDRVQDFEFMLRYSEQSSRIAHVSKVLYHWRAAEGSVAAKQNAKGDLEALQVGAVQAQLDRLKLPADVVPSPCTHMVRVMPRALSNPQKVSVIIVTNRGIEVSTNCVVSLFGQTTYANFEVICVDNGSEDFNSLELMRDFPLTRLSYREPFNVSVANNIGLAHAAGHYVVFISKDIEIVTPNWIEQMVYYAQQDDVGVVGGLLISADRTVQHAGIVLDRHAIDACAFKWATGDSDHFWGSLTCAHEVSAVTAACMMARKKLLIENGGFNINLSRGYQDIDLCLQLRSRGKRNIFTPHAVFIDHDTNGRHDNPTDRNLVTSRWRELIAAGDPYYPLSQGSEVQGEKVR